jgi:hypothetical protein
MVCIGEREVAIDAEVEDAAEAPLSPKTEAGKLDERHERVANGGLGLTIAALERVHQFEDHDPLSPGDGIDAPLMPGNRSAE